MGLGICSMFPRKANSPQKKTGYMPTQNASGLGAVSHGVIQNIIRAYTKGNSKTFCFQEIILCG